MDFSLFDSPELDTISKNNISNDGLNLYINFINTLEGYKTNIKDLHWAATNLNIHKELDTLLSTVSNIQDSIAEDIMGIYGNQIFFTKLVGIPCKHTDAIELIEGLRSKVKDFYSTLPVNDVLIVGIKSEIETFIHDLNKLKYLFKLCKA